ncbi:MAG: hypothetical protein KDA37_07895 [Planctomycetales bacterium]|nr:hypothetical protein [Planctomycetales bacterium]
MRSALTLWLILATAPVVTAQGRYGDSSLPPLSGLEDSLPASGAPPMPGGFNGLPATNGGASTAPPLPTAAPMPRLPAATTTPSAPTRDYGRPAASVLSTPPAASTDSRVSPTALMRGMLRAPSGSRLSGEAVKMEEVIGSGSSRSAQTQRINAYWDLCSSITDYYLGMAEAAELSWRQQSGGGGPALSDAVNQWRTRNETSYLAARAAQNRLASLMGRSDNLLPGDLPLCSSYKTKYSQIFQGRASTEAELLDKLIPLRYAELCDAANSVVRSQEFVQQVKAQNDAGAGMVRALELLALNRRAFVQIAKDYNRQITRYTELSTPGNIATDRLTKMLVERQQSTATASQSRPLTFRPGLQ